MEYYIYIYICIIFFNYLKKKGKKFTIWMKRIPIWMKLEIETHLLGNVSCLKDNKVRDKKYLVFSPTYLIGRMKKQRDKNFFI